MKKRQVWQYICEFCGKRRLSKGAMTKHEKHCTMNPHRSCRMCEFSGNSGKDLDRLKALLPPAELFKGEISNEAEDAVNAAIPDLRDAAEGCPACMMAALRQTGIPIPMVSGFDYDAECAEFWKVVNEERAKDVYY